MTAEHSPSKVDQYLHNIHAPPTCTVQYVPK